MTPIVNAFSPLAPDSKYETALNIHIFYILLSVSKPLYLSI